MTANQMAVLFQDLFDGSIAEEMGFTDEERSRFLTLAQWDVQRQRQFPNRNVYREGFENNVKRDTELVELKKTVVIYNDPANNRSVIRDEDSTVSLAYLGLWKSSIFNNGTVIELPSDFLYWSVEKVDLLKNGTRLRNIPVKQLNEDNMQEHTVNSFTAPHKGLVYRVSKQRRVSGNTDEDQSERTPRRCTIITGADETLERYWLKYIRRASDIVVDFITTANQRHCELDESIHDAVVRQAVKIAMGSIASQRYQLVDKERLESD